MDVTQPTAAKAVARLNREGLAISRPYRGVFLTESGTALATRAHARHRTMVDRLIAIELVPETAKLDAEGMGHHASDAMRGAVKTFLAARVKA